MAPLLLSQLIRLEVIRSCYDCRTRLLVIAPSRCLNFLIYFSDQAEARRNKVREARKRREERQAVKKAETQKIFAKEDEAAKK